MAFQCVSLTSYRNLHPMLQLVLPVMTLVVLRLLGSAIYNVFLQYVEFLPIFVRILKGERLLSSLLVPFYSHLKIHADFAIAHCVIYRDRNLRQSGSYLHFLHSV